MKVQRWNGKQKRGYDTSIVLETRQYLLTVHQEKDCWDSNLEAENKEITSGKQGIVLEEYAILLQNN